MNKRIIPFLMLMLFSVSCSGFSSTSPQYSGQIYFVADTLDSTIISTINLDTSKINILIEERDRYLVDEMDVSLDNKFIIYAKGNIVREGVTISIFPDSLYIANSDGSEKRDLEIGLDFIGKPRISINNDFIVFSMIEDDQTEIFIWHIDDSSLVNLSQHKANDYEPAWSPDGSKIAFASNRDGNCEIYVMNADGSDQVNLTNYPTDDSEPTWSPDGNFIAFVSEIDYYTYIYIMSSAGSGRDLLIKDNKINGISIYDQYSPVWRP